MPKIVTVHGTFAHIDASDDPVEHQMAGYRQWWESGSTFEARLLELIDAETDAAGHDEPISFHPFVWDGQNSERSRRNAGTRLLDELDELEGKNETYCIVGHSHGGSVIASALLQAADRGTELNGLRRWITIGTPFVELRRERFLFLRLPLLLKAMFVASLMLLFMYLFYVVGELLDGQRMITNENQLIRLAVSTVLTALPFIAFYIVALIIDRRKLYLYRRRTRQQAQQQFEDKWVGLSHEDDEAVRGLGSLRTMRLQIFHRNFAVPILSLLSVFILPLVYLYVLMSPSLMVGIADYLKTNVYEIGNYSGQMRGVDDVLTSLRQKRRELQRAQRELGEFDLAPGRKLDLDATVRRLRNDQRNLRR
ncbi:MAG: hypothetical protein ACR2PA_16465, partial [Hyphomicrobiaceae bacterium]